MSLETVKLDCVSNGYRSISIDNMLTKEDSDRLIVLPFLNYTIKKPTSVNHNIFDYFKN